VSVPNVLREILAVKVDEVKAAKAARSIGELEADCKGLAKARGLRAALIRPPGAEVRVLAEIKRASPSAGAIRAGADPAEIARAYAGGGAAALSVLTDRRFFDGDLAFLALARAACALPILRKDFVIDPHQIVEARASGADAVLLIVAALSAQQLGELAACAAEHGLDALVEVHDDAEADTALAIGTTLLGVNHRDLRTFQIDMSLTGAIAGRVPPDVVLVAESGIKVHADVQLLGAVGAHAVLVGEQLMRAPSPGAALKTLRGVS
jgi:indole-3-glycerol phosphate synthase